MDDFLYNVRTGNIKNMNKPNRRFDNNRFKGQERSYNKSNNRYPANKDQRKGYVNYRSLSTDQFTTLKDLLGAVVENQKRQLALAESGAARQERQTVAIETIAKHLGRLAKASPGAAVAKPDSASTISPAAPSPAATMSSSHSDSSQAKPKSRSELVSLITKLRGQRLSYDKIALEFEKMQVPTLSGRGHWRGQTIYRLFKEG